MLIPDRQPEQGETMSFRRVMTRSGGRTEANRQAVAQAVLRLLSEGRLNFDAQEVAELSGVHRTTIQRRWPNHDALIAEAMAEHTSRLTVDLKGDWRAVLRRIAFGLRDFMRDPTEFALTRYLPASESSELLDLTARQWGGLFAELAAPLLEAQRRGSIRADADIEIIIIGLASTMSTLTTYNRRAPSDATTERLVKQALRGMRPNGAPTAKSEG
jgi:AcrR family transcriptional regulator